MNLVQQITGDPLQKQTLTLENGERVSLTIYFRPIQFGWFINELSYNDFTLYGMRITNNWNLLYPWKNKLPFGLACISTNNREPQLQNDFLSGASKLYVLTPADVKEFEAYLSA